MRSPCMRLLERDDVDDRDGEVALTPRADIELLGATQNVVVSRLRVDRWPAESRWYGCCNSAWGQTLNVRLNDHCEAAAPRVD
jgi:hypothetical protein